jgi:hypothetical protein
MTAEAIEEAEVRELDEPRALVTVDHGIAATGALALAALPDDEFDRRLAALEKGRDRVERIQKALMARDVDYGVIPGTPKPTLYKAGAEILCLAYSLAADFQPTRTVGDGLSSPNLSYLTRCDLHLGSLDGPVIAVGYGAANSWERKHRYRRGERTCPACGKVGTIIKGKAEYGGGWLCWKKKDGCDAKWSDGASEIEQQAVGDVENPDPFDLDVVLAKMAEKRAHVDATLRATNASRLFTQDIEDLARPEPAPPAVERVDGGLIGDASLGKPPVDGELREQPDGWAVGFVLGSGRDRLQVIAYGDLAQALVVAIPTFLGQRVQVFGPVTNETMRIGRRDVPFQRVTLERIVTPDLIIPPDVPVDVESHALFHDDDLSDLDF